MPRDGSGAYSAPAGTLATPNTAIESSKHNAFVNDLVQDANTARPVTAGGTGASTAQAAINNLFAGGKTVDDDELLIADPADNTKRARIDAGSVTAGQTRVLTAPDHSGTLQTVEMPERSAPTTASGQGALYTKDSGTQPELFFREESDGDEVQITSNGGVRSSVLATEVTLSGSSSASFSIPAWANNIEIGFHRISGNATSSVYVRIGDSGGVEDTGYLGAISVTGGSITNTTNGFYFTNDQTAASFTNGVMSLRRLSTDGTRWAALSTAAFSSATALHVSAGSKALSAQLTTVDVILNSGTFDDGYVNVSYW